MGKIKDWLDWKINGKLPQATAMDFYLMLDYYDIKSPNIAVIGNPSKYKWVINNLIKQLKKEKHAEDRVIKVSDKKYIFLRNGQESTFVHIDDLKTELMENKIKYRKYM